jgi:hypothetical protein
LFSAKEETCSAPQNVFLISRRQRKYRWPALIPADLYNPFCIFPIRKTLALHNSQRKVFVFLMILL